MSRVTAGHCAAVTAGGVTPSRGITHIQKPLRHVVRADVGRIAAIGPRALERDVGLELGFALPRTIHPLERVIRICE